MTGTFFAPTSTWTSPATSALRERDSVCNYILKAESLDILVILAGPDSACTALASGLRGHSALVCESEPRALQVVGRGFIPDVVLIDTRIPNAAFLAGQIAAQLPGQSVDFVALSQPTDRALSPVFAHRVTYPAAASEIEQIIWQVEGTRTMSRSKVANWREEAV